MHGLLRSTGCPSPRNPPDDARSTPQNRALVTSGNDVGRNSGGLPSGLGSGIALRLRSSRLFACAALLPLADRRPKPRWARLRIVSNIQTTGPMEEANSILMGAANDAVLLSLHQLGRRDL